MIDEAIIFRRIDFLLREAASERPFRDQTVTYAMRVISNFYSVGRDISSADAKRHSKRMSRKALELKKLTTESEWVKNVVNEHQEPLKRIWSWIVDRKGSLSREELASRFKEWPMVTVTREEDICLRKYPNCEPAERYRRAGIEVLIFRDRDWKAEADYQ